MLEMALVENIQREDLDAIEVAISFKRLMEECALTQEELASRVGKQRSTVSNYIPFARSPRQHSAIGGGRASEFWSCPGAGRTAGAEEPEGPVPPHPRQGVECASDRARGQRNRGPKARPKSRMPLPSACRCKPCVPTCEAGSRAVPSTSRPRSDGAGRIELYFQDAEDLQQLLDELGAQ